MEDSGTGFPGFQNCVHKDDFVFRRSLSRLQSRAPSPLQLRPPAPSACDGAPIPYVCGSNPSSSSSSSSSLNSFYQSKDPIPLLSPLVLPSLLGSACIQEGNAAKSR